MRKVEVPRSSAQVEGEKKQKWRTKRRLPRRREEEDGRIEPICYSRRRVLLGS